MTIFINDDWKEISGCQSAPFGSCIKSIKIEKAKVFALDINKLTVNC